MDTEFILQDDDLIISKTEDVEPFLDFAAAKRNAGDVGSSDMRYVMTIPPIVVDMYINETGISFKEFMNNPVHVTRLCNDPDYKHLRIWEGRI